MKKISLLTYAKIVVFRLFKPVEKTFAYNRMRRDKWMMKQAKNIPNGSKILDVGAGGCPYRNLYSHCEYSSHDFAQLSSSQIQDEGGYGKIDFVSDILSIPVPDGSYDVVLCTEVIEHVPYPIEVIKEISRILKPGGKLLITAPLQSSLHQEPYHFYGGFTKHWFLKFLTENNFSDINIQENGSLHTSYFALGLTMVKSFLESILSDKNVVRKLVSLLSLVVFSPILLILNPVFCFLWERIYQIKSATAGYHVSTKKSM